MTAESKAGTLSHELPPGLPEGANIPALLGFFASLNGAFEHGYDPESDYRISLFPFPISFSFLFITPN
jgi:hypothetical protein